MATTTYCNEQDLINRKSNREIAELTGDSTGQAVDSAKVTEAIEDYADKINAAVRKNYPDLPFDNTHRLLNGLNMQGAYLLLVRDGERGWTDEDREDWKMLEKNIEQIAKGILDLRSETEEEAEIMTEGSFSSNKKIFGRGKGL